MLPLWSLKYLNEEKLINKVLFLITKTINMKKLLLSATLALGLPLLGIAAFKGAPTAAPAANVQPADETATVSYTVNMTGEGTGTVTVEDYYSYEIYAPGDPIEQNAPVVFYIYPDEGCGIVSVKLIEEGYDDYDATSYFGVLGGAFEGWYMSGNLVVDVEFKQLDTYNLTVEPCENGSITVSYNGQTVESGSSIYGDVAYKVVVTPDEGYELSTMTLNGEPFTGSTFTATSDVTLAATFVEYVPGNYALHLQPQGETSSAVGRTLVDRVEIPNSVVMESETAPVPSFTMSTWVKFNSFVEESDADNVHQFMGHRAHCFDNDNGSMLLGLDKTTNVLKLASGAGNASGEVGTEPIELDRWYYISLAYDADAQSFSVYTDGVLQKTLPNGKPWSLFADEDRTHSDLHTMFFVGGHTTDILVDEVAFYDHALTAEELAVAMEIPGVAGLKARYTFDHVTPGTVSQFVNVAAADNEPSCSMRRSEYGKPYGWIYSTTACNEYKPEMVQGRELVEYCAPDVVKNHDRATSGITVTVGAAKKEFTLTDVQKAGRDAVYFDRTDFIFQANAGDAIIVDPDATGEWMHGYFYVDFGKDGEFSTVLNPDHTCAPESDLVAYDSYAEDNTNYYKSDGTSCSDHRANTNPLPAFTLPENLPAGLYRVRFKSDWNCIDPCGNTASNDLIQNNGGVIIDFTMQVLEAPLRTVTTAVNNAELGSVVITTPETEGNTVTTRSEVVLKAVPVDGAVLVNWTNAAGVIVGTEDEYTYTDGVDETITANFGYVLTVVEGEGTLIVRDADNNTYENGSKVAYGTELTISIRETADLQLKHLIVNGVEVTADVVDFAYTFTVESAPSIEAEFGAPTYMLNVEYVGEGTGEVYASVDEEGATRDVEANAEIAVEGDDLYIIFVPAEGSKFVSAVIAGDEYEANEDNYTIVAPKYIMAWGTGDNVDVVATFDKDNAIELVGVDAAEATFYNLQGVRVAADNLTPGVYVMRRGNEVVKVLVK